MERKLGQGPQQPTLTIDIVTTSRIQILAIAIALTLAGGSTSSCRRPSDGGSAGGEARRGGQVVASVRGEPRTFNRLVGDDQTADLIAALTYGRLVRINRVTFELEPWLAERWETSEDGRTYTLHLRPGITWSDGAPLTAADVVFSVEATFDPKTNSVLASSVGVGGQPLRAEARDASTVVVTYPAPSGPGIRLLDNLWILPKHKLEGALRAGTLATAWDTKTPAAEVVGAGPFVLREYQPGQRMIFDRNPHYWRRAEGGEPLPYLDRLVIEIVPDQNTELLRLQAGEIDMTSYELRPDDYVTVKRAADEGRIRLVELGIGADPDAFWFCLKPEARKKDPKFAFVQKREFRQAIAHAVDREQFANVVYLGAAVPVWGPITPGNKPWYWPDVPKYPFDPARARALLKSIGLEDRNGNGTVEDAKGTEARFTVITQRGITNYERATALLRDGLAKIGIALDIVPLEFGAMIQRMTSSDYEAIYMRVLATALDPAMNKDLWLSSGSFHYWNLEQKTPATEWERRIDTLMLEQAATTDAARRREIFNEVQRIFAENLPALHFVAPRIYAAHSARVEGVTPSIMRPPLLWNPDTMRVTGPPRRRTMN